MSPLKANLTVVGLGYIGLPTAAVFASSGMFVRGMDIDSRAVSAINEGSAHIVEPGLDAVIASAVAAGRFVASTEIAPSDAFIVAVPTPFMEGNKPDLSYVETAVRAIAPHLQNGDLVIIESTCPIGATEQVETWLAALRPDLYFPSAAPAGAETVAIAYCPERVLPGNILHELVNNDRVIGGITDRCSHKAAGLYRLVVEGDCHVTTARTAEFAKLAENSYRDVNIAFANELSVVAADVGVNVWDLIDLANLHPRVDILRPGPGVGGHCIAVDPWFIVNASEHTDLIRTARLVNDAKPDWVVQEVLEAASGLERPSVACLGLTYKPNVDDCRESPALEIVRRLSRCSDMRVIAVEPNLTELPDPLVATKVEFSTLDAALEVSNIVLVLVAHDEVLGISPQLLTGKTIVDPVGAFAHQDPGRSHQ